LTIENTNEIDGFETTAITQPQYSFDEIERAEKEWIPYNRAIERIAATTLIPYPPGIPLLVQGEKITGVQIGRLEELLAIGAMFQGDHRLQEKLIQVII